MLVSCETVLVWRTSDTRINGCEPHLSGASNCKSRATLNGRSTLVLWYSLFHSSLTDLRLRILMTFNLIWFWVTNWPISQKIHGGTLSSILSKR